MTLEPYVETRSGKCFYFLDPQDDQIDIADIAYALANQCRYNGHCSRFYSVAEHSVLVASLVDDEYKLSALLHDAAEAFLSDIPSPVKQFMPEYKKLERGVMDAIAKKFNITEHEGAEVKLADRQQLCTEAYNLLPSRGTTWEITKDLSFKDGRKPMCLAPRDAFGLFMSVFDNLTYKKESLIVLA